MSTTPELRCVRLSTEHARAAADLLGRAAGPCYCRYWHFEGDKNAWLARCAHEPEKSRCDFELHAHTPRLHGIVALTAEGTAVGWMKIAEQASLRKLYEQRVYRGLPCFSGAREDVYAVGCFVVDEAFRRQGVARALLRAGVAEAQREGAVAVEAFPRGAADISEAELWTGPLSLFMSEGFEIVNDFPPYPVLRRNLGK